MEHDPHRLNAPRPLRFDLIARGPGALDPIIRAIRLEGRPPHHHPLPRHAGGDGFLGVVNGLDNAKEGVSRSDAFGRCAQRWLLIGRVVWSAHYLGGGGRLC